MKTPKKTINLAVPAELLEHFNAVCMEYGHAKQKGLVLSAAISMFLRADPVDQGQAIENIVRAEIAEGVSRMVQRGKQEQSLRIATRKATQSAAGLNATVPTPSGKTLPRKAAKKAGGASAKRAIKKLPKLDDLA